MRKLAVAAASLLAVAACVPQRPPAWRATEPTFVAAKAGFELVPPPGWMLLARGDPEILLITRDGAPLQRIHAGATEVGKPIQMGDGKRVVTAGMSAQELAELVVDEMRATEALTDLRILENAPARLGGRDGFRLLAAFRDGSGLRRRVACYGVLDGGRFYRVTYVAPERHYFARDLPAFEEIARSFRLRPPAAAQPAPEGGGR